MPRSPLAVVILLAACAATPAMQPAPHPDPAALTDTPTAQFARSAEAWNRGDLDAFLSDYARDGRTTSSGSFTLVMERCPDGWKILHDHTSSD